MMAKKKTLPGSTYPALLDWEIADTNWNRYIRARDAGHTEYIEEARTFDNFFRGEQWDEADRQRLESEGRPALTINLIMSTVNAVQGEQANKRAQIHFKPKREALQTTADTLNKLYMVISDTNQLDHKESAMFGDGLIQDRGYLDVRIDFSEHLGGEVKVTLEDPLDIVLDPDAKEYDPETWGEVTKSRWHSFEELGQLYGEDKLEELETVMRGEHHYGFDSVYVSQQRFGSDNTGDYTDSTELIEAEQRLVRSIRVIERQYRVPATVEYFVSSTHGDTSPVPEHWDEERKVQHEEKYQLFRTSRVEHRVRWTVTADHVKLRDDWSPYPFFTIVPYFPYFRRGRPFGMVRNLISPQKYLNKVSSQELHVVNTTANSGWVVEDGSLANMDIDELEERGAETGLIISHHRGSTPPAKIQPNQIPTGLDRISLKAATNIKEISGVTESMLGTDSPEVSGVVLDKKTQRGLVKIQVPLENLKLTRLILARNILWLIQAYYTEPRIYYMTADPKPGQPEEQGQLPINQPQQNGFILNDVTRGKYDIVVTEAPSRDTFTDIQLAEAVGLRQAGIAIPDDVIIEYSHLSEKLAVAERVRQMQGTAEPSPEEQQMQQALQQLQFQQMQLQLKAMEEQINKIGSETRLNLANAAKAMQTGDTLQHQEKELAAKIGMNTQDNITDLETTKLNVMQRHVEKNIENQTRIATALIRANEQRRKLKEKPNSGNT